MKTICAYLPQDAGAERRRIEKRRAALFIQKLVSNIRWRSLLVSWHTWQLYLVREDSFFHSERHRQSRILIGLHHVIHNFVLRRTQSAWRVWTRACDTASHNEAVNTFKKKAQASAMKFFERACVSKSTKKLQRAWNIWQEGMLIAEKEQFQQVCGLATANLRMFRTEQ